MGERADAETILSTVRLGLEHEMQHQELLVYDIKHLLCDQYDAPMAPPPRAIETVSGMSQVEGGLFELGYGTARGSERVASNSDFAFDNEKPQHKVFSRTFGLIAPW